MFADVVVDHPNPGVGCPASNCVSHSSGAFSKAAQIAFSRDIESRPTFAFTPLIISVGDPPTSYFSLSALWILNCGNLPFIHFDLSFRFSIIANSLSVAVVHVSSFVLSIPVESRHPGPSPASRKHVR